MDISLIEFGVYGAITYSGIILLLISTVKEVPTSKPLSIIRAIYFLLPITTAIILSGSGLNITTESQTLDLVALTYNETNDLIFNTTTTHNMTQQYTLENPIWIVMHYLMAVVMIVYVIQQMLILFTKV